MRFGNTGLVFIFLPVSSDLVFDIKHNTDKWEGTRISL
jgi:hypothetical protein